MTSIDTLIVAGFAFAAAASGVVAYLVVLATEHDRDDDVPAPPPPARPSSRAKHAAGPYAPVVRLAGSDDGPPYWNAYNGRSHEVPVPTPRPFTPADGIPRLVVDSPPGARGVIPVDVVDVPVAFRPACSWCLDGVRVATGLLACPVCHCPARGMTS